ncbi:MAG: hypothetical protein ABIJ45_04000 [Candidatus Zixiibacteriota bacterium]
MNKFSGETLMKIGWAAVSIVVIIFMLFYRDVIPADNKVAISGLFALAWGASSVIYGGGMRAIKKHRQHLSKLDSRNP